MAETKSMREELESRTKNVRVPIEYAYEIPDMLLPKVPFISVFNDYHEYLETDKNTYNAAYCPLRQDILCANFKERVRALVTAAITYTSAQYFPNHNIISLYIGNERIEKYMSDNICIEKFLQVPDSQCMEDYVDQVVFGLAEIFYNSFADSVVRDKHRKNVNLKLPKRRYNSRSDEFVEDDDYGYYPDTYVSFNLDTLADFTSVLIDNLKTAIGRLAFELLNVYIPSGASRNFSADEVSMMLYGKPAPKAIEAGKEVMNDEPSRQIFIEGDVNKDDVNSFVRALEKIVKDIKRNPNEFEICEF